MSPEAIRRIEKQIIWKSKRRCGPPKADFLENEPNCSVEDVDNIFVRRTIPEWITRNIPHNKRWKVREAISRTLWSLCPPSTQSAMWVAERSYRSRSMEPPGYELTCPSDHDSEGKKYEKVEVVETRKRILEQTEAQPRPKKRKIASSA